MYEKEEDGMGPKERIAFWIWIAIVIFGVALATTSESRPRTYVGSKIEMVASSGHTLSINKRTTIEGGNSKKWRMRRDENHFYGEQEEIPVDYEHDDYFYGQQEISAGKWEVVEGQVSLKITPADGEEPPIQILRSCTARKIIKIALRDLVIGIAIWFVGIAVYEAFTVDPYIH